MPPRLRNGRRGLKQEMAGNRPLHAIVKTAATLVAVLTLTTAGAGLGEVRGVPERLTNTEFWRLVTTFSESNGRFPADNFVSNELAFQAVIPRLQTTLSRGGVYLGVGPDQNFTYIAAMEPTLSFIVDIRRQNLTLHLLYKALFEVSDTRAQFLSRLFGRRQPGDLGADAEIGVLMNAFAASAPDAGAFKRTLTMVMAQLEEIHGFTLSRADRQRIEYLLDRFHEYGPNINYAPLPLAEDPGLPGLMSLSPFPSFAVVMQQTDGAGVNHAYLASETQYQRVRELQLRNAIVPIVGDFAGPTALRAVGAYVRKHGDVITAIYTSNVEQYLFQYDVWRTYYETVAALPIDESSVFIRAYFPNGGWVASRDVRLLQFGAERPPILSSLYPESTTRLSTVAALLAAVEAGTARTYLDVVNLSR